MKVYLSGVKGFVSKAGKRYVILSICDPEKQMYIKPEDSRVFNIGRETGDPVFLPESMYDRLDEIAAHIDEVIDLVKESDFKGRETLVDIRFNGGDNND